MPVELTTFEALPVEDLELLVDGLEALERRGVRSETTPGDFFGNLIAAKDADEAQQILKARSNEAKNSIRAKKRRVALLKAALIELQISKEAAAFFAPQQQA